MSKEQTNKSLKKSTHTFLDVVAKSCKHPKWQLELLCVTLVFIVFPSHASEAHAADHDTVFLSGQIQVRLSTRLL